MIELSKTNNILKDSLDYLLNNPISKYEEIGPITLYSTQRIHHDLNSDISKYLIKKKFLQIGDGANGDPIVLNYNEGFSVGFLFHDQVFLMNDKEIDFVKSSESLYDFINNAYNDKNFPQDACQAEDILETLKNRKPEKFYYFNSSVEVNLNDLVEVKGFFKKKKGEVKYLPGISKFSSEMEHGGLKWIGVNYLDKTEAGISVDPDSNYLNKSVKLLKRKEI